MSQKELINREITGRRERIRGKVLTEPRQLNFDTSGVDFPIFVVDVDIGGDRVLQGVPVKINGPKARFYARPGFPVFLEKNAQGRYQVVSPADRSIQQGNLILINEDTNVVTAGALTGFSLVIEPFIFYQGVTPESFFDPGADANTLVWLRTYDRALGINDNIALSSDVDGANVLSVTDKSGNGHSPTQTTASLFPLYRKFDSTGGNTNFRSTADFDGATDIMDFPGVVNETTGGQISIFVLLQKDAVGSGDDVVLELGDWRVLSRRSAGDTWGFSQGGVVQDSASTIGTSFVLIEIIATSFAAVNLYEDGTLLQTLTGLSGSGHGLGTSSFGGSVALGDHNGRVAEMLVMDETVSAAKRVTIENYFNQTMFVAFAKWKNTIDGFPKIRVLDADGNEVIL